MIVSPALYNEWDKGAAAWLRELIREGHLPEGVVDERSVADLDAGDTGPVSHFFAGIGGWPLALRLAGWPDDRPVWTASLPCQPFSVAGKRRGAEDERHLAPVFLDLVRECRPPIVFGEQVAGADGRAWLADLRAEMEALGYAVGAADLCAAGVGAPHIRQRLFWGAARLADADDEADVGRGIFGPGQGDGSGAGAARERPAGLRADGGVADCAGWRGSDEREQRGGQQRREPGYDRACMGAGGAERGAPLPTDSGRPGAPHGGWADADWLLCRDGKWRSVRPGSFPLADGLPARVGRLRGYGNAIVPALAAEFVTAFMEAAA